MVGTHSRKLISLQEKGKGEGGLAVYDTIAKCIYTYILYRNETVRLIEWSEGHITPSIIDRISYIARDPKHYVAISDSSQEV